jgi:transcriptional regulator with PAS, ATPase and Fis domain
VDTLAQTIIIRLNLIGESPAFMKALEQCASVAPHHVTVLLAGETGTGKELFARTIHQLSPQAAGPFVPVDCAALPDTLFANELFGHEKGAFTDASERKKGLIALAAGGTLFLDEIDSLTFSAQGTLLRLLENKTWRPLGSDTFRPLACRIIVATNKDLLQLVQAKTFRVDLYYRLDTITIHLPSLRERRQDIPLLVSHFLSVFSEAYKKEKLTISEEALMALCRYDFPGNIRELQNILQKAIIHTSGKVIKIQDIEIQAASYNASSLSWRESRKQAISDWEKTYLTHYLSISSGDISSMAHQLGIGKRMIYRLLKRYQLR